MRLKCGKHQGEYAGWRCGTCGATLCADCVAWKIAGTTRMEACTRCGGFAQQLKVSRSEQEPFGVKALLAAVRWPFSPVGILCIAASTAFATMLGFAGAKGSFIATGVIVAYLFQIVRHTARGGDDFPGPDDFQGYFEDVVGPSLRVTVALAWIWVPALVFTIWGGQRRDPVVEQQRAIHEALKPGGPGLRVSRGTKVVSTPTGIEVIPEDAPPPAPSPEQIQAQQDEPEAPPVVEEATPAPKPAGRWIPILLVLLGVAIAPMSLLASALKTPLSVAANPVVLIAYAAKLGKDYALLVGFCVVIVALTWLTGVVGNVTFAGPLLGSALTNFEKLALAFVAFRGIGLLVRARGAELGYGGEDAYMVPALGDAQPRGTLAPPPPREKPPPTPIELPPAPPNDPSAAMVKAIAQNDDDACLALVEELGVKLAATAASPERWMKLARLAIERKKPKSAAVCLRRCLDSAPQGPLAPEAWLLAARVYDEYLGDRATSKRLLGELAKRFPSSKEGAFAAKRLAT